MRAYLPGAWLTPLAVCDEFASQSHKHIFDVCSVLSTSVRRARTGRQVDVESNAIIGWCRVANTSLRCVRRAIVVAIAVKVFKLSPGVLRTPPQHRD